MTRARRELVSVETTPYYHVISRCVRRAYLCGTDNFSGKSYEHRKAWAVERLRELDKVFTVDLCAYAIMSNHIHLVVRLEGRFKSQSLLDEAAVLTCMSYVDLNPIRAALAETPEISEYTSIQQRIEQWKKTTQQKNTAPRPRVMPLVEQHRDPHQNAIGFTLRDYLELVDWAGRQVREGKRGAIAENAPSILQRLGLNAQRFMHQMEGRSKPHSYAVLGEVTRIRELAAQLGRRCIKGVGAAGLLYETTI